MKAHQHIWIAPIALILWAVAGLLGLLLLIRDFIMHRLR